MGPFFLVKMNQENLEKLNNLASLAAQSQSCKLYDLEFSNNRLQIYLFKDNGQVDLEDCSQVSRFLDEKLESIDFLNSAYELEVSSPGLERQLKQDWHFQTALNKRIEVKLFQAYGRYSPEPKKLEKQKILQGKLVAIEGEKIQIHHDSGVKLELELAWITKANLVFEF